MKRLGRPPSPHKTRHVMINMKDEHYAHMRQANTNMSQLINHYLDNLFHQKICPMCFTDNLERKSCAKCGGEAIFCANTECVEFSHRVGYSCPQVMWFGKMKPECTPEEFYGE
jgi:hypothetical protein